MFRKLLRLSISDAFFENFTFSTKVILLRSNRESSLRRSITFVERKIEHQKASEMLNLETCLTSEINSYCPKKTL